MFTENDFMTPKERVNEALRARMLEAQNGECRESCPSCESQHSSHSGKKTWGLEDYPLASVYAPLQSWRNLYDAEAGLSRGTIFKELDLPFLCGERKGGNCRGR